MIDNINLRSDFSNRFRYATSRIRKPSFNSNGLNRPKNLGPVILIIILLAVAFYAGGRFFPQGGTISLDERANAPKPIATQTLNKKFEFPLRDSEGKEVSRIEYVVENANIQDAFIYQGKLARAVKGRTFLILNLKITNPYRQSIEINAKDYIRVRLNNSAEQLAPEIHNDPVEIQANSTKYTRIGLPINDSDKNIILMVGEITGRKDAVKLTLER
ncbi:MAG: hypothetical protein HYW63_03430 [Candidatus Levybacteria bacterium]|nr:hypothetical protein [Candidatus Levybacteria bacterium]